MPELNTPSPDLESEAPESSKPWAEQSAKAEAEVDPEDLRDYGDDSLSDDDLVATPFEIVDDLDFDELESGGETGRWGEFAVTFESGDKIKEFRFEILIFPYMSEKNQALYARLQKAAIDGSKKLQQARNRALRRGERWELPPSIQLGINRRVLIEGVIGNWRGWSSLPYSRANAERLLKRVPALVNDIIDFAGSQARFLSVREKDAVSD
jgi:hypothetical protein